MVVECVTSMKSEGFYHASACTGYTVDRTATVLGPNASCVQAHSRGSPDNVIDSELRRLAFPNDGRGPCNSARVLCVASSKCAIVSGEIVLVAASARDQKLTQRWCRKCDERYQCARLFPSLDGLATERLFRVHTTDAFALRARF